MTDWARVEQLRGRGLSWEEIADDEKVGFSPPPGTQRPGLALKSLYLQRRSKRQRERRSGSPSSSSRGREEKEQRALDQRGRRWGLLALLGMVIVLAGAVPAAISLGVPLVSAIVPLLSLVLVATVGAVLLALSFVISSKEALRRWKRNVAAGVVVALIVTAGLVLVAYGANCPNLSASTTLEHSGSTQGSWVKANNPIWSSGDQPVLFYWGSTACPYCSASSWALRGALEAFGTLSGTSYGHSDPSDSYGNGVGVSEVLLDSSTLQGTYLTWDVKETVQSTVNPVEPGCPEKAYISAYDSTTSIPFVVVGGLYIHASSLVDPGCLLSSGCGTASGTPLTAQQIESDLSSGTGPVYNAIHTAQIDLEAFLLKVVQMAQGPGAGPTAVKNDPAVIAVLDGIT